MTSSAMWSRRQFLTFVTTRLAAPGLLAGSLGGAYTLYEAKRPEISRVAIAVRNLPAAFDGMTAAFLSDTHHGPFVPLSYLAEVVETTNALRPDVVLLGGDYVQRRKGLRRFRPARNEEIIKGVGVLGALRAPEGRFAVLGNHDHRTNPALVRRTLAANDFTDLTNTGRWLQRGESRLRIAGVDDIRTGRPRLGPALQGVGPGDACLLLTHNPDYVEYIRDPRVDLVLSGHTHGGQVVLPFYGAPLTSSDFGQKYRAGLVQGPKARVYVSRGIGTISLPVRFCCPPEIVLVTLRQPLSASR